MLRPEVIKLVEALEENRPVRNLKRPMDVSQKAPKQNLAPMCFDEAMARRCGVNYGGVG